VSTSVKADPIAVLMDEHRLIERVLDAFYTRLSRLGQEPFPRSFFEQSLDFFRHFADGCHHGKEEDQLFPLLEQRGIPREGGPLGCMLKEHDIGRDCLAAIRRNLDAAAGGDADALAQVRDAGTAFVQMLRQHIMKEDQILFQMALRALTPADMDTLDAGFHDAANPKIGPEVRARYEALAGELAAAAA
jgi:hemerythrin-like domain-containing protein